nr:Txe/YoeB family addiction module toxin [uncultured Rhizobium sp.]
MNLLWTRNAWEEYQYWQSVDQSMVEKINELIRDTKRSPFKGLGKPEPLKGSLSGFWSRRILGEHRLVYCVSGKGSTQQLQIIQCRFHYER